MRQFNPKINNHFKLDLKFKTERVITAANVPLNRSSHFQVEVQLVSIIN